MKTPGKTVVKAEEFWATKQTVVDAFNKGEDNVSKFLAFLNAPDEAIVES